MAQGAPSFCVAFPVDFFEVGPMACCRYSTAACRSNSMRNKVNIAGIIGKFWQEIKQENDVPAVF